MIKLEDNPPMRISDLPLSSFEGSWWVAHTKSRCEKALAWELVSREINYFLPMVKRTAVWGGRKRQVLKPMFSSYLFFCGTDLDRQAAMATDRIFMTIPVRQRDQFIKELEAIHVAIANDIDLEIENLIVAGRPCRVKRGPLKGIEGTIIQQQGRTRLLLQVSMVGRGTSLEIEADWLEPMD